jgi:hypothetical protein
MTTDEIIAIMTRFTDPDCSRYPGLAAPWVADGHLIATDGRVVAFCPVVDVGVSATHFEPVGKVPGLQSLFAMPDRERYGPPVPIPKVDPQWKACEECDGLGGFAMTHDGEKYVPWNKDDPQVYMCEDCDGSGRFEVIERVQIGATDSGKPLFYNDHYLARLREAGVTHLRVPRKSSTVPARGQVGPITVLLMGLADQERAKPEGGAA